MKYTLSQIKKTNLEDTFFGMYFYRKLATYFTYFFSQTSITPNQISFLSLLFALLSVPFFAVGTFYANCIAIIFLQVGMILDYSDGQIARLKKLGTKRGAWLDVILGMIQNNLVILGMILGIYSHIPFLTVWVIGFITLFAWNMTCFVHLNAMIFFPNLELKKTKMASSVRKGFHIKPQFFSIGSDVYFMVLSISLLLGYPIYGFIFMAMLGNLYWIAVSIFMFRSTKHVI